jgi:hypothetical protein
VLSNQNWDIHPNGHCFHPLGLDAYIDTESAKLDARRVVGPYSRGGDRLQTGLIADATRSLFLQLENELFDPGQFVLFGVLQQNRDEGVAIRVLDSECFFLPNPTMRTSLCDAFSQEQRASLAGREWEVNYAQNAVKHRAGLEFRYSISEDSVVAYCTSRSNLNRNVPNPLLEVLGEQGYAVLSGFCKNRLFQRFELVGPDVFSSASSSMN